MAVFADNSFPVSLSDPAFQRSSSGKENPAATRYCLMGKEAWLFGPSRVVNWRKAGKAVRIDPLGPVWFGGTRQK
jgi:hypothetical protein